MQPIGNEGVVPILRQPNLQRLKLGTVTDNRRGHDPPPETAPLKRLCTAAGIASGGAAGGVPAGAGFRLVETT